MIEPARRPVWQALSTLFLDTELAPEDLEQVATVLAASPYSRAELWQILATEVRPVLWSNLISPAGVHDAFDPAWLEAEIVRRRRRPRCLRYPAFLIPDLGVRAAWEELAARIATLRAAEPQLEPD